MFRLIVVSAGCDGSCVLHGADDGRCKPVDRVFGFHLVFCAICRTRVSLSRGTHRTRFSAARCRNLESDISREGLGILPKKSLICTSFQRHRRRRCCKHRILFLARCQPCGHDGRGAAYQRCKWPFPESRQGMLRSAIDESPLPSATFCLPKAYSAIPRLYRGFKPIPWGILQRRFQQPPPLQQCDVDLALPLKMSPAQLWSFV